MSDVKMPGLIGGMSFKHTKEGVVCVIKVEVAAADVEADDLRDLMSHPIEIDLTRMQPRMFGSNRTSEEGLG